MLEQWRGISIPESGYLCYALDHQYTDQGLKLANLKGDDYCRVRFVADSCAKSGKFCFLLTNIVNETSYDEDDEERTGDESWEIKMRPIMTLEGLKLQTGEKRSGHHLLQPGLYDDREPDTCTDGGHYGNYSVNSNQIYNDTVSD